MIALVLLWPRLLLLLFAVPLLLIGYLALVRRQNRRTAELASKGFRVNDPIGEKLRRRRHIPYALFLLGLALIIGSTTRPQATVRIPQREGTVILAFDVSNSMRAKDLEPTRIDAAKKAAAEFVAKQPKEIRIGVVAFNDSAITTQQPTTDRADVLASIKGLTPRGGTSLGQGILSSLQAITGKPLMRKGDDAAATADTTTSLPDSNAGAAPPAEAFSSEDVEIGFYPSAAILLLTDGENNARLDPVEVAKVAAVAGVKVHTIAVGSAEGTTLDIDGYKVSTALDEEQLRTISDLTDGTYYAAEAGTSLAKIYDSVKLETKVRPEQTEITALLSAAALASLGIGALLSLRWFGRVV